MAHAPGERTKENTAVNHHCWKGGGGCCSSTFQTVHGIVSCQISSGSTLEIQGCWNSRSMQVFLGGPLHLQPGDLLHSLSTRMIHLPFLFKEPMLNMLSISIFATWRMAQSTSKNTFANKEYCIAMLSGSRLKKKALHQATVMNVLFPTFKEPYLARLPSWILPGDHFRTDVRCWLLRYSFLNPYWSDIKQTAVVCLGHHRFT